MTGGLIGLRVEPTFFVGTNATGASPALTTLIHFTTPGIGVDIGYTAERSHPRGKRPSLFAGDADRAPSSSE